MSGAPTGEALHRLLNQYRSAEIRGAGVILRLGRLADTSDLRANFTKHLRDEGVHAWMWTRTLQELGMSVEDVDDPYQQRLGAEYGMPRSIEDLLVLTVVSERRGVTSYEEHLGREGNPPAVERSLRAILKDERWHVSWIDEELQRRAASDPRIAELEQRAAAADEVAAASVRALVG